MSLHCTLTYHILALQAAAKALRTQGDLPSDFARLLIQGLKLVLELNAFQFNKRLFLQTKGTAMGTRVAPSSACLTMGDIEKKILTNATLKPYLWLRYIDDIFVIWTHDPDN